MGATVTSLSASLKLNDVNFGSGLVRAEQSASKFSKQLTKVGNSVGTFSMLAAELNQVAASTGQANGLLGGFASSLSTTATTVSSATNLVFGLTGAMNALKMATMTNPIGLAITGLSIAGGLALSYFSKSEESAGRLSKHATKIADEVERAARVRQGMAGTFSDHHTNDWADDALKRAEAAEQSRERLMDLQRSIQERIRSDGESPLETERRHLEEVAGKAVITQDHRKHLLEDLEKATQLEERRRKMQERAEEQAKRNNELTESMREIERSANQAWMTDSEKKLERLKELGATQLELERAAKNLEKAEEPANKRNMLSNAERTIAQLEKDEGKSISLASPKALLKGTYEAAFAEEARKNTVDKLTEADKKKLEEARKTRTMIEQQLRELNRKIQPIRVVSI